MNNKARNDANNANTIKNAAEVASKVNHPVAKAIGEGVKIADKISGGKASEKLGKAFTRANKFAPGGRAVQRLSNKLAESGAGDKIGSAASKMGGSSGGSGTADRINGALKNKNNASQLNNVKTPSIQQKSADTAGNVADTVEEKTGESTDSGVGSFKASMRFVKIGLAVFCAVFPVIIFCNLFVSASQIFVNSISLGEADNLSGSEVEDKINKKGTEDLDEEKTDDDIAYDIYISDEDSITLRNSKLNGNAIKQINGSEYLKRKYNEASLDELEDFYPAIVDVSKNYDENMVYDFFFKMYKLYTYYRDEYNAYLDLPLLMSTLNLQSTDKMVVFEANLAKEDRQSTVRETPEEYDYYYDWTTSNYKISRNNSEHDMEVLAQHMVSKQVKEKCVDSSKAVVQENILKDGEIGSVTLTCAESETYETEDLGFKVDNEKYREFLKEFLEKKYYLDGEHEIESKPAEKPSSNSDSQTSTKEENPNYTEDVTFLEGGFSSNVFYYNQTNYQDYYFTSDPYNKAGYTTNYCYLGKADCRQTIASSGCGPTSMAIAVSTLLGEAHDPIELTTKVCTNGGCYQSGTSGASFAPTAAEYGLKVENTDDAQKVSDALATGNSVVIALMGPGNFTSGGHYINLTGVKNNGEVYVADCFRETNNGWWSMSTIVEQKSGSYSFWIVSR